MAKRNSTTRIDLHTALKEKSFDHAAICTFEFNAPFFENYCLDRLAAFNACKNLTVILDRGVYEKAILGLESHRPEKANIRYLLHPISTKGVFHTKLFLLASRNKGRLIIGSANLTRPGLTSNAELVSIYDFETEKNETLKPLFQMGFHYLFELGRRWHSETLISNLEAIKREVTWLTANDDTTEKTNLGEVNFLHNLEESLWEQLEKVVTSPTQTIYILSRYFDAAPQILDRVYSKLKPEKIKIFTQNRITNLTTEWLKHPTVKNGKTEIYLCRYIDEDEHAQHLHAKAFIIENETDRLFAFGSANFTSAALLKTPETGNVETLILLRGEHTKKLQPKKLFDPNQTAELLKHETNLQSSRDEVDYTESGKNEIVLLEAILNEDKLYIRAEISDLYEETELRANLTAQLGFKRMLPIYNQSDNKYTTIIPEDIKQQLSKSSTTLKIEAYEDTSLIGSSNPILVTNLLDFQTDKPVSRERHIKEAQQSATQFLAVLRDLLQDSDEQALLTFLNYCDIQVVNAARPSMLRSSKSVWDGGAGMRNLGEKNLKIYLELHKATIAFYERHYKRLQRHAASKSLEGIANFLHIFLAMGGVLRAQMERLTQGVEARTSHSSEEWYECRKNIDSYMDRFKQMIDCISKDYLSQMSKTFDIDEIKKQINPDLLSLQELYKNMLNYRERFEQLKIKKVSIRTIQGKYIELNYFDCVLKTDRWTKYERDVQISLNYIEGLDKVGQNVWR